MPKNSLPERGPFVECFRQAGCQTMRDAARLVQGFAYGRTQGGGDFQRVLVEERGTCTSKHALVAALGVEIGLDIELVVACFEMNEANTPGAGCVLDRHGLSSILEAHTFVRIDGASMDLTWPEPSIDAQMRLWGEFATTPESIASEKRVFHEAMMREWAERCGGAVSIMPAETLWSIREECIAALSGAFGDDGLE